MELMWKGIGIGLVCCVLSLSVREREKDLSALLAIGACTAVSVMAISCMEPVVSLLRRLESLGPLHSEHLSILIKAVGIGIVTDISVRFCNDAGNSGTGKVLQLLGSAVMLRSSLPVFDALLELICSVLGEI